MQRRILLYFAGLSNQIAQDEEKGWNQPAFASVGCIGEIFHSLMFKRLCRSTELAKEVGTDF